MPRRDGTGPMGAGPMTGRGVGPCNTNMVKYGAAGLGLLGLGYGCKRGYRWFANMQNNTLSDKEVLRQQKERLQNELNAINKQLED